MDNNIPRIRPLRRAEASAYLDEVHAIKHSPQTLAKKAITGCGPAFRRIGRIPVYDPADLDAYAASITTPKVTSTSELGRRKTAPTGQT